MIAPVIAELFIEFQAPPEELWPLIADTNRFNRAIGLPRVRFSRVSGVNESQQIGRLDIPGGSQVRWIEHPFEWERPHHFSVVRDYLGGPLSRLLAGTEFQVAGQGTRVRFFAEMTPRNVLFAPLIRYVVAPLQLKRARKQLGEIAAYLEHRSAAPFPDLSHRPTDQEIESVRTRTERLAEVGVVQTIISNLSEYLLRASDEDVSGMRPLELAARWDTDPRMTLETFLHAATIGLLEMRWELLCPSCRGVNVASLELHQLSGQGHCESCNLSFSASIDEAIEARFYPAPSIRPVGTGSYCVGGPMNTPHRRAQLELEAGQSRDIDVALDPGSILIRSPQSQSVALVTVDSGATHGPLEIALSSATITPEQSRAQTGLAHLRLSNHTAARMVVAVDDGRWSELAASPGKLMTFPAFRSLFSSEALAPGVELAVGRAGFLFTDLAGSTALYDRAGESAAFRLVSDHFIILQRVIEEHHGALIKTIGDAVMAAFPNGADALAASFAMQREILELDTRNLTEAAQLLKIGVHAGPCFVVTLNDRLDYFGTTVNIAARAQGEALGGEVVATLAVTQEADPSVLELSAPGESFEVVLRGLTASVPLMRFHGPYRGGTETDAGESDAG